MLIRYIIKRRSRNGVEESAARDFEKQSLLIGRGADCDIILESRRVSLNHALLSIEGGRLIIADRGSTSGVQVNGELVKQANLKSGDTVKLADCEFVIGREGEVWILREHREEAAAESDEATVAAWADRIDIFRTFPSFRTLSVALFLICLAVFFLWPFASGRRQSWSSGPISRPHQMIAGNCRSCHEGGFARVKDAACLACHAMTDHAPIFAENHPTLQRRCAECHLEHNGDRLLISQSGLCTQCHADLGTAYPQSKHPDIKGWDTHPEFAVGLKDSNGIVQRVRLSDTAKAIDPTTLKLNHSVHLQPDIRGPSGPVTLTCNSCHKLAPDHRTILPIVMERDCKSCHTLEFDDRLPGREVPHGDPNIVYRFLYSEYAKLSLAENGGESGGSSADLRGKPGGRAESMAISAATQREFSRANVETESRRAEQLLFTRTACKLCHKIDPAAIDPQAAKDQGQSRYEVVKPHIPDRWLPASRFSHGAHEEVRCQECHTAVEKSEKTGDLLLPPIKSCRTCHAQNSEPGKVASECVLCHSFHDSLAIPAARKKTISQISERK